MQGMTPDQYDERVRYSIATQQLPASIQGSAFTSKTLAQHLTELAEQQREVQGIAFHPRDYAAKVQPRTRNCRRITTRIATTSPRRYGNDPVPL
jgi:hypothetical protein